MRHELRPRGRALGIYGGIRRNWAVLGNIVPGINIRGDAVTSHSSQGLAAECVPVNADTGVYPDLRNSRFGYVSISRASHEATLFTDDMNRLSPQLSADVSKTSALEIGQSASLAQEIAMT